jgi:hypothetical protein
MFGWLTSWWTTEGMYGPARNAPAGGINIKLFLEQRPTQVIIVSGEEILTIRNGLRKTEINAVPPISNKNPIMKEFDDVFSQGYQQFFQKRKQQRANIEIIISNPDPEVAPTESIVESPVVDTEKIETSVVNTEEIQTSNVETSESQI